jgi:hypothetical protein
MQEVNELNQINALSPPTSGELPLDPTKYYSLLNGFEISEDQKRDLLETMWSIMRLFVEFGFSVEVAGRALKEIFARAALTDQSGENE